MRNVYDAWETWAKVQAEHGSMSHADREKPALLNRFDWYSAHNWSVAYPGDPKIYRPDQVPGATCRRRLSARTRQLERRVPGLGARRTRLGRESSRVASRGSG